MLLIPLSPRMSSQTREVLINYVMIPALDASQTPQKRPRVAEYRRRNVKYQRHSKPPYTYLGMTVVAIQSSPDKSLTLGGIHSALGDMFSFFQGQYRGWRDSVRHNLSFNACFVKSTTKSRDKNCSGCYWTVDLSLVPVDGFKRAKVSKELENKWAPTLTEQLQIPNIILPLSRPPPIKVQRGKTTAVLEQAASTPSTNATEHQQLVQNRSLSYTEAQYTRYLREQTPTDAPVPLSQYPQFASLLYDTATSPDYAAAADNLHSLCRPSYYGTPIQEERSTDNVQAALQLPVLKFEALVNDNSSCSRTDRVLDTPPTEIAPSNDDPFAHMLSSWRTVPDSLLSLSLDIEQTTSGRPPCREDRLQSTFSDTKPRDLDPPLNENVPTFANPHSSTSGHDVDVKPRFKNFVKPPLTSWVFVPTPPPSDCSSISYISDTSQLSSTSHCAFPCSDTSQLSTSHCAFPCSDTSQLSATSHCAFPCSDTSQLSTSHCAFPCSDTSQLSATSQCAFPCSETSQLSTSQCAFPCSETSQLSTSPCVFPYSDFSTVSFQDQSSRSNIFP